MTNFDTATGILKRPDYYKLYVIHFLDTSNILTKVLITFAYGIVLVLNTDANGGHVAQPG
jgi:hypothetical protein